MHPPPIKANVKTRVTPVKMLNYYKTLSKARVTTFANHFCHSSTFSLRTRYLLSEETSLCSCPTESKGAPLRPTAASAAVRCDHRHTTTVATSTLPLRSWVTGDVTSPATSPLYVTSPPSLRSVAERLPFLFGEDGTILLSIS